MSAPDRRAMVERPGKDLSVRRQCVLLSFDALGGLPLQACRRGGRSGRDAPYRRTLHLELPFYGSRRMTFELNREGREVTMASGEVTPDEAATVASVLEMRRKTLEIDELVLRVKALEEKAQER